MSEAWVGPGWWMASDGRWYAPEQHPWVRDQTSESHRGAPAPDTPTAPRVQGPSVAPGSQWSPWVGPPTSSPPGAPPPSVGPETMMVSGHRPPEKRLESWKVITGIGLVLLLLLIATSVVLGSRSNPKASTDHSATASTAPSPPRGNSTPSLVVGPKITLPAALYTANPEGSPQLVTPTQATGIATTMWQLRQSALIKGDTTALTQLEAPGLLRQGDLYDCAELAACGQRSSPRPINSLIPVVPVQSAYPIYFLAEVATDVYIPSTGPDQPGTQILPSAPGIELDVLTKATSSASWQLSFETDYSGTNGNEAPDTPFDFAGAGSPVTTSTPRSFNTAPATSPPVPVSQFLPLLAAYWQSWKDVQASPPNTVFADGPFTSEFGQEIGQDPQGTVFSGQYKIRNKTYYYAYSTDYSYAFDASQGSWEFSAGGFPVECGTILATATSQELDGGVLNQDANRSNWGIPLSPGLYRSIATEKTHQSCVLVSQGSQLEAEGNDGTDVNVTGVPAR